MQDNSITEDEKTKLINKVSDAEEGASPAEMKQLMRMLGESKGHRGYTKPPFSKAKRTIRNTISKASRKKNRGVNQNKRSTK